MIIRYTIMCCFVFKQKTAYEMRISDWSADVCSSDLAEGPLPMRPARRCRGRGLAPGRRRGFQDRQRFELQGAGWRSRDISADRQCLRLHQRAVCQLAVRTNRRQPTARSEEHTSELQSLMRISYAVFCLKKKQKETSHIYIPRKHIKSNSK